MAPAKCTFSFRTGNYLEAFSLDSAVSSNDLASRLLQMSEKGFNSRKDFSPFSMKRALSSLEGLEARVSADAYSVPGPLRPYRDALGRLGRHEDLPVMMVRGSVGIPLDVFYGTYLDFKATELTAVPAELLPQSYPSGKTIRELLPELGLGVQQLARYLGFAFILMTSGGNELVFVQRGQDVGIAPGAMALPGATPPFPDGFLKGGFKFARYSREIVEAEIAEEFKLARDEFRIERCYLVDDKSSIPFVAVEVVADLAAEKIAERCFADAEVLKEHTILYAVQRMAVQDVVGMFPLLPSSAYVLVRQHSSATRRTT